ncbi:MAG: hypothetical protein KAJ51_02685, partial [Thermoplasmata archaeon]|nr:hypothetical protein [Thermoplasmata archaeon]
PDLNISVHGIRLTPETPNDEQEITVNYTVTNLGEPSNDEFIIKAYQVYGFEEYEKFITQHSIKGIEGDGTIRQFEFGFIAETPGEINLKIIIDPDNDYKEHNKNNNLAEIEIYVNNLPDAQGLSVSPDRIYRTDEFVVQVQGADVESLTADLTPILEAKAEPSGEWFEFENEQFVTQYNSSGDTWDFTIMSNTSMALGKYSLRISFIDDNNAAGKYYFLHRVLEVLNNLPGMDEIIFDRTVVNRTERIWATINVSDIETDFFELEVEAQYRFKPKDIQSPSGWLNVDYLQSSAKINWTSPFMEDFWLAMVEFDSNSKIGYYQFRARAIDIDLNASDWMYPEIDLTVLNNPPKVSNITFQGSSVYRTETLQIEVRGIDIEDEVRL